MMFELIFKFTNFVAWLYAGLMCLCCHPELPLFSFLCIVHKFLKLVKIIQSCSFSSIKMFGVLNFCTYNNFDPFVFSKHLTFVCLPATFLASLAHFFLSLFSHTLPKFFFPARLGRFDRRAQISAWDAAAADTLLLLLLRLSRARMLLLLMPLLLLLPQPCITHEHKDYSKKK